MKWILLNMFVLAVGLTGFQHNGSLSSPALPSQQDDDTLIWQAANNFTALFNNGDTAAMNQFLPESFMLQWLHDNFFGKKGVLNTMVDASVHATLKHRLNHDAQTIGYSDDHNTACLDATFSFFDETLVESSGILNLPLSLLEGTPFKNFLIPGILLTTIVGCVNLAAVFSHMQRNPNRYNWSIAGGITITVWIIMQILLIGSAHWLHFLYPGIGILIILIAYQLKGKWAV